LVTFQTVLFGAVGVAIEKHYAALIPLLGVIGLGLSMLWGLVGYEDRVLVVRYRGHVKQAFCRVLSLLDVLDMPVAGYVHVGEDKGIPTPPPEKKSPAQPDTGEALIRRIARTAQDWLRSRVPHVFSITLLPIRVAGSFTLIWTALLILHYMYKIFAGLPG